MASTAKSIARARRLKRIGVIGLGISTLFIVIVLIVSFLPKATGSFTINADRTEAASHFVMSSKNSGDKETSESYFWKAQSLKNVYTTDAENVESFLNSPYEIVTKEGGDPSAKSDLVKSHVELIGSTNFIQLIKEGTKDAVTKERALVFTVDLVANAKEDQNLGFTVSLDNYVVGDRSSNDPLDYFRIVIREEYEGTVKLSYFAKSIDRDRYNESVMGNREPISLDWDSPLSMTDEGLIQTTYDSTGKGNDGYCINFNNPMITRDIINAQPITTIAKGKTLRFTVVAYYDGNDLDCQGEKPNDSSMTLSLHFGLLEEEQ